MSGRRGLTVVALLLAAGGVLLFIGGGRGLGLLAIAGLVAIIATTGIVRTVVGSAMVLVGSVAAFLVLTDATSTATDSKRVAAAVGALAIAVAGLLVVAFGRQWPGSGGRYERDRAADVPTKPKTTLDQWRALDRGEDPTVDDSAASDE